MLVHNMGYNKDDKPTSLLIYCLQRQKLVCQHLCTTKKDKMPVKVNVCLCRLTLIYLKKDSDNFDMHSKFVIRPTFCT